MLLCCICRILDSAFNSPFVIAMIPFPSFERSLLTINTLNTAIMSRQTDNIFGIYFVAVLGVDGLWFGEAVARFGVIM